MSSQKMILVLFEFSKINTMCLKQVCVSNISKKEIIFSQKDVAENSEDIYGGELCNSSQRLLAANYCCKVLHLRCLQRSLLRLS